MIYNGEIMRRVLVIEQEESLRLALVNWLLLDNFKVTNVENSTTGLELVQSQLFDIVLCDMDSLTFSDSLLLRSLHASPIKGSFS